MYSIVLIGILIVVSGIIAFLGDRIGMKLGRKRLSLFGLRPRWTAITVSIIAGILTTTTTLTVLMICSRPVRIALTGVENILREENLLRMQRERLSLDVKKKAQELENMKEESKKARKEIESLIQIEKNLKSKISTLDRERETLVKTVTGLQEKVDTLQATIKYLVPAREKNVIFRVNQEIETKIIRGGRGELDLENDLAMLLESANEIAKKKGARGKTEGEKAVRISPERIEKVLEVLSKNRKDMIVRLVSLLNSVEGEAVLADFEVFENKLVFKKNEVIFQTKVDGSLPQEQILMILLKEVLRKQVKMVAIQRGMIPEPITGSVGEIPYEDLKTIAEEISNYKETVKVKVYAVDDTWSVGPLKVGLAIEKL